MDLLNRFRSVSNDITLKINILEYFDYVELVCMVILNLDVCDSKPCQNGGTCAITSDGDYQCSCSAGFSGTTCETGKWLIMTKFSIFINVSACARSFCWG